MCRSCLARPLGPAYLLCRSIDVCVVYICGPSDLSNIMNVIDLVNFNHHLSCVAALHRRLYVRPSNSEIIQSTISSHIMFQANHVINRLKSNILSTTACTTS